MEVTAEGVRVKLVALRKESVDRNLRTPSVALCTACVALRKESVDRNSKRSALTRWACTSLSARRAWIEMT